MSTQFKYDLIILVPGHDDREAIDGLLEYRCESIGISPIRHKFIVHPRRDPGCFNEAAEMLQPYIRNARYALVIFDHEGSGQETKSRQEISRELEILLSRHGWENRIKVIVIEPELENWIWSDSPRVDEVLGWHGHDPPLRNWLHNNGLLPNGQLKPPKPKEAFRKALRESRIHPSSALFADLAERVSLERCQDSAFNELKNVLKSWFSH